MEEGSQRHLGPILVHLPPRRITAMVTLWVATQQADGHDGNPMGNGDAMGDGHDGNSTGDGDPVVDGHGGDSVADDDSMGVMVAMATPWTLSVTATQWALAVIMHLKYCVKSGLLASRKILWLWSVSREGCPGQWWCHRPRRCSRTVDT